MEDTLELIFVRQGRENLDSEIKAIFGKEEKNTNSNNSLEKSITFSEYLEKINKKAIN